MSEKVSKGSKVKESSKKRAQVVEDESEIIPVKSRYNSIVKSNLTKEKT